MTAMRYCSWVSARCPTGSNVAGAQTAVAIFGSGLACQRVSDVRQSSGVTKSGDTSEIDAGREIDVFIKCRRQILPFTETIFEPNMVDYRYAPFTRFIGFGPIDTMTNKIIRITFKIDRI